MHFHNFLRVGLRFLLGLVGLLLLLVFGYFAPALYHRLVTFPRLEAETLDLQQQRRPASIPVPLSDFRCVFHVHSFWSHDSRGVLSEIVPAAEKAGIDAIFLTDHPHAPVDSFPRGYHGRYQQVLIVPGSETHRLLIWPLRPARFDLRLSQPALIDTVVAMGGLVFFAHSEDEHPWYHPRYHGMEIYNIHTDLKDERFFRLLPEVILNRGRYHRWVYRQIFDTPQSLLAKWDSLNQQRRIVGIAGNDAHNNQNLRARYLDANHVEWVGPNADAIDTTRAGFLERWLLDEPDSAGWAFRWDIDPYYESFRHVTTHVFADTLTPEALREHLLAGHVYVAFENLVQADGFFFWAEDGNNTVGMMGDSIALTPQLRLHAQTPIPAHFRIVHNGTAGPATGPARHWTESVTAPGVYRMEVWITLAGQEVPWIYSNPIYIYDNRRSSLDSR